MSKRDAYILDELEEDLRVGVRCEVATDLGGNVRGLPPELTPGRHFEAKDDALDILFDICQAVSPTGLILCVQNAVLFYNK
jgi:hypothetical protein